jgi:hypothetical protein
VAISPTDAGPLDCLGGETVTESDATQVPEARATEECGVETVVLCGLVQVPDVRACEACGRETVALEARELEARVREAVKLCDEIQPPVSCGGEAVVLRRGIHSPRVVVRDPCAGVE